MATHPEPFSPAQLELMELAARLFQRLGMPRSTGQIYAILFVSPKPLSLDDIAEALAISKTSASTGTRQLMAFNMIRQVWMPGERRDHFEARTDVREVLRANYHSFVKPRLEAAEQNVARIRRQLEQDRDAGRLPTEAYETAHERLEKLAEVQKKMMSLLPLAEGLL
jgi:DNA-binding transcriptional regulator GbsR (MarR family)